LDPFEREHHSGEGSCDFSYPGIAEPDNWQGAGHIYELGVHHAVFHN